MSVQDAIKQTQRFVDHIKKCIAESDDIDPKYKDAVIQSFQNTADSLFAIPSVELEERIRKIKSMNLTEEQLDDLTAEMLAYGINNQIADYKKYEESNDE